MNQLTNNSHTRVKALQNNDALYLASFLVSIVLFFIASVANANNTRNGLIGLGEQTELAAAVQLPSKESYLAYADQLLGKEQFDRALKFYTKVIRMDRDSDDAFLGRSIAYSAVGRLEDSIADLNVFILRNPGHSMAHVYRGIRYMSKGDVEFAEKNLLKAIRLNPKNARAYDDLGVVYAQQGYITHALKYFGQALRLDPYSETAYHNLAMAYFLLEDNEKALGSVNRAIRLTPEAYDSYILKAQILDALGQIDEAKKVRHYAKFLDRKDWQDSASIN